MKKVESFSLFFGPGLLFASLIALVLKVGIFCGLIWLAGLLLSSFLALFITYLVYKERQSEKSSYDEESSQRDLEIAQLRSSLDETHILYRAKIDRLEEEFTKKEAEWQSLHDAYEKLYEEEGRQRKEKKDFQVSLEDALEELRLLRQRDFLDGQNQKKTPKALLAKYNQLRMQFAEKSDVLEETRKKLFSLDSELHLLKQQQLEPIMPTVDMIRELFEENERLSGEVTALEELVTSLFPKRKKAAPKQKEKLEQMLEFTFESTKSGSQSPQG